MTEIEQRIEDALPRASHTLYASAYADVCEDRNYDLSSWSGQNLLDVIPEAPGSVALGRDLLDQINNRWTYPVAIVFDAAGIILPNDIEHAIADLFLGCVGHGVNLHDDFSNQISLAEDKLDSYFDPIPVEFDDWQFREIAMDAIDADKNFSLRKLN